jgi:hypothetical protein
VKLTISAAGRAAPSVVWDRYIHTDRWGEWSPQIRSVDCADVILLAGSSGVVHGPCGVGIDFVVIDVDHENRCWSWRVKSVGVALTLDHSVAGRAQGDTAGSSTSLTIIGPAPVVLGYAPIARLALGRLVR